ncbi:MAG: hypothetical protein OEW15_09140 [Nitrospirota bacterium]|nr:hypothetical protein [Nitrospirota bacterium]
MRENVPKVSLEHSLRRHMYPTSREDIEAAKKECEKMLTKRALLSAAAGLSPMIGPDITADMALLLDQLRGNEVHY